MFVSYFFFTAELLYRFSQRIYQRSNGFEDLIVGGIESYLTYH